MDDMLQNRMNQCLIVQEWKNLKKNGKSQIYNRFHVSTSVAMLIPRDHRTGEALRHVPHQALLADFTIF